MAIKKTEGKDPKDPNEEQVEEQGAPPDVEDLVNRTVNAALSAHMSRVKSSLAKELGASLGTLVTDAMKPLSEQLASLKPVAQATEGEPKPDVERAKLNDRIQELEKRARDAEAARESEVKARSRDEERQALADALRKGGVTDAQVRAAVALLYTEEKLVARNEANKIVLKAQGKYGEELVPLEEGVLTWLKSDEGKVFLPARGAAGSGNVAGNGAGKYVNAKDAKKMAKEEAYNVLMRTVMGENE